MIKSSVILSVLEPRNFPLYPCDQLSVVPINLPWGPQCVVLLSPWLSRAEGCLQGDLLPTLDVVYNIVAVQPPFLASWQCKREKMRILALKTSPLINMKLRACRLPLLNKQEFASHECIQTGPSPLKHPKELKCGNETLLHPFGL